MPHLPAPSWLTAAPFAHRGLHDARAGRIENSPAAFAAAMEAGYGIELDVQLTADGQAVVFHDDRLERLTAHTGAVIDRTLHDLEGVTLQGSRDNIPALETVLAKVRGQVPVLVEIKAARPHSGGAPHALERAVARTLDGYRGPVAVMSFSPSVVGWFRDHCPGFVRGFVASPRYRRSLGWPLSQPRVQARHARDLDPAFVAYDIRSVPNGFTRDWRNQGRPLLTWTVRTADHRVRARQHADNIIFEEA